MIPIVSKESFLEHRKSIKLFAELAVVVLAVVFLLLPGILRESENFIGDKPYYHLRLAKGGSDELSFGGRENVNAGGWNLLLRFFPLKVVLFVMGLVSLGLFFLNLKGFSLTKKLLSMGFFIVSPAFIYLFNVGERFGIALVFSLLAGFFLIRKKYLFSLVAGLVILLFDYYLALFVLLGCGVYWLYVQGRKMEMGVGLGLFLVLVLVFGEWNKNFISDLGAEIGVSVFALFFIMFCFILFWNKRKFLSLYGVFLVLLVFALRFEFGVFYFSLFLSVLMTLYFVELYGMRWESKLVRDLTLLIVVCGLLFSGLSYANRLAGGMPNEEVFEVLGKLPEGKVVFSDVDYGHWIAYSGKKNVWDSFTNVDGFEERERDINEVINSRDAFRTNEILNKYGVDYVMVDSKIREKWGERGLLYLLKYNTEAFSKIKEGDVEVWRYYR